MNDWQLSINGLVMGPGTQYIVNSVDGFGIPEVRDGDVARPQDIGDFYGQEYIGNRTVTPVVTITAWDGTFVTAQGLYDALVAAWQVDGSNTTNTAPLTVTRTGINAQRWNGRPRRLASVTTSQASGIIYCTLEYVCADPRIYDDALSTGTTGLPASTVGLTYPRTYPRVYGTASSAGVIAALNSGNIAVYPLATITGPCTGPILTNGTTGARIASTLTLGASDVMVVDFDQKTITFNGAQRWALTQDSAWWSLAAGTTNVLFNASGFSAGASLSLSWRSARIG